MDRQALLAKSRETFERAAQFAAARVGYDVVRHHFYSPLPDIDHLQPGLWPGPQPTPGLDMKIEAAVELVRVDLRPFLDEWHPPIEQTGTPGEFFVKNISYASVDAEVLYAMVRHRKPKNVVELGSGASSHVIDLARRRNADDGSPFAHTIFDPFPFEANPMGRVDAATVKPKFAQDIHLEELSMLEAGDVLFVDTTHTVKTGGDVNRIVLEIVPSLKPDVLVHVHDIFLPYEYPKHWVVENRFAWAEQYLLQAFLAFNDSFEVIFPSHAVAREHPEVLRDAIPSFANGDFRPGSFWFRRTK